MKLLIEIPDKVKMVFDKAENNVLKGSYYDHGGIIGAAIKNGIPFEQVIDGINYKYCPNCGAKMIGRIRNETDN